MNKIEELKQLILKMYGAYAISSGLTREEQQNDSCVSDFKKTLKLIEEIKDERTDR